VDVRRLVLDNSRYMREFPTRLVKLEDGIYQYYQYIIGNTTDGAAEENG
jgi:hypothetical protein